MKTVTKMGTSVPLIAAHALLTVLIVAVALVRWPIRIAFGAASSVVTETHVLGDELVHEAVQFHSVVTETLTNITKD